MRALVVLGLGLGACATGTAPVTRDRPDGGAVAAPDATIADDELDATPPDASAPPADAAMIAPIDQAPIDGDLGGLVGTLHVPPGIAVGEPRPLVVVLHGCWEDADVHEANAGWDVLADARRLYVIHAGEVTHANQCLDWWSTTSQAGGGDAAGVIAMIDAVTASYDVDPARVYVDGFSSGGALAVILLATHPARFAGAIVHAGLPYRGYTGTDTGTLAYIFTEHDQAPATRAAAMPAPGAYPPIVAFVGAADTTVHPTFTRELVDQWTAVAGADQVVDHQGRLKPDHAGHTLREYRDADGDLVIATVTIDGMAHGYAVDPSGASDDAGGGAAASAPGHASYGKDVGLWATYWGAEALGIE